MRTDPSLLAEEENSVIEDDPMMTTNTTNTIANDDMLDQVPANPTISNNDNNPILSHRYSQEKFSKPPGVALFGTFFKFNSISAKRTFHKTLILFITYLAYTCFHMGRRPLSIVKNVLNRNCSELTPPHKEDPSELLAGDMAYMDYELTTTPSPTWCDFPPFDNDATANQLLAILDFAFLFSYAFFMFFSGFLADRCNLRYFLSGGMVLSGLLLYAFGLAYTIHIHSMTYFVIVQILSGAIQTVGWPSVVSCIGHWFDQSSRGSIFGLWNSNTNLGNILGATIAGYFVETNWGLSFMVPGFIMLITGVVVFLFLVPKPTDVGLFPIKSLANSKVNGTTSPVEQEAIVEEAIRPMDSSFRGNANRRKHIRESPSDATQEEDGNQTLIDSEHRPLIVTSAGDDQSEIHPPTHAVSFWTCLRIPGVVEYSFCLGFAKLVSYTFLYWLPRYITQSTSNNSEDSAYLSVPFDIGGMIGAILAGFLSDRYKKSALTCTVMLILAIPSMVVYEKFAHISNLYNICIQLLTGSLVNGPYSLITTAVSTDLGSRIKDGKAMATVAAIIDGTGSIGAAIGPLFAGYLSDSGWTGVFMMLMISDLLAALCLIRITLKEIGFR